MGRADTYVAVEQLIRAGTGGVGPLGGIRPARLSVLYLEFFQLRQKKSLLVYLPTNRAVMDPGTAGTHTGNHESCIIDTTTCSKYKPTSEYYQNSDQPFSYSEFKEVKELLVWRNHPYNMKESCVFFCVIIPEPELPL